MSPKCCVANNCIGARIRNARKNAGFSQVDLAAAMCVDFNIEMDRAQISKIERGIRSVRDKEIVALIQILNISPNWLFGSWETNDWKMKMDYTKIIEGNTCKISMFGMFTFTDHARFRELICLLTNENIQEIVLDVNGIEFVDSAGLGLFLLIKEEAEKKSITLTILKPRNQLEQMFNLAKFDKIFNIAE